ncbi:MAG TPA: transcription termination factor NusA [Planctomycetaceae bacterium]|nr:transcription termination factor NusA [Planctomycetaceae bacterium]
MNSREMLNLIDLVDTIHRDRRIDKEIIFSGIEAGIVAAVRKRAVDFRTGVEEPVVEVHIDRKSGEITGTRDGVALAPAEIDGRIIAQSAKQVISHKINEAVCDALYEEYRPKIDQLISGEVVKNDRGTTIIALPQPGGGGMRGEKDKIEAILPRGEKIPGEMYHLKTMVRALVVDVKKDTTRVKVIVSRTRPLLVQRLFEQEIPDIADGIVEIKGVAREPGHRTKIAVYSSDQRVDCVGACIGVRGSRIKNITEELNERIDVVPWDPDMQIYIPNALKPAEVEEVILCTMLGRAVVLVRQEDRSLAIGRKGQNVRLASKLCGWDIEIMTRDELEGMLEKALAGYAEIDGINSELADRLVGEGFLSFDDLSIIEPIDLMQMGDLTQEQAEAIIAQVEERAEEEERNATARPGPDDNSNDNGNDNDRDSDNDNDDAEEEEK